MDPLVDMRYKLSIFFSHTVDECGRGAECDFLSDAEVTSVFGMKYCCNGNNVSFDVIRGSEEAGTDDYIACFCSGNQPSLDGEGFVGPADGGVVVEVP